MHLKNKPWNRLESVIVTPTPPKDPKRGAARDSCKVMNSIYGSCCLTRLGKICRIVIRRNRPAIDGYSDESARRFSM